MASIQQQPVNPPATMGGDKHADPPAAHDTKDEVTLKDKMEALLAFVKHCRYGMMTTHDSNKKTLVSRCMELAATVRFSPWS